MKALSNLTILYDFYGNVVEVTLLLFVKLPDTLNLVKKKNYGAQKSYIWPVHNHLNFINLIFLEDIERY